MKGEATKMSPRQVLWGHSVIELLANEFHSGDFAGVHFRRWMKERALSHEKRCPIPGEIFYL